VELYMSFGRIHRLHPQDKVIKPGSEIMVKILEAEIQGKVVKNIVLSKSRFPGAE
jgi:hypothetical protein